MILANFRVPKLASKSFLAPVQTNLPDRNISAVHRGSRILITTPWNLDGLYSEFLVRKLMCCKFKLHPKSTVATQFWILIELTASCGSGIGLCGTMLHCGGSCEPAGPGVSDPGCYFSQTTAYLNQCYLEKNVDHNLTFGVLAYEYVGDDRVNGLFSRVFRGESDSFWSMFMKIS